MLFFTQRPKAANQLKSMDSPAYLRAGFRYLSSLGFLAVTLCAITFSTYASETGGQAEKTVTLRNERIAIDVGIQNGHLGSLQVTNLQTGRIQDIPEVFSFTLKKSQAIYVSGMRVLGPFSMEDLKADPAASRLSERLPGQQACVELADAKGSLHVRWCGILRKGSVYFRQRVTIQTDETSLPITEVCLLDFHDADAHVAGTVKGSPIIDKTMFFGFEHPLSMSRVVDGHVNAKLVRRLPLRKGEVVVYSSVIGLAEQGQMRRAFLGYLERERAHPYRPFLLYNTWYDIGYPSGSHGSRYNSAQALDRIRAFGSELVNRRHVRLDSFAFDTGWDNPKSVWNFNSGFLNGFAPEQSAAAQYHAGIGVWLSPWGGYAPEKQERVAAGRDAGYEILNDGLALSGSRYYQRFASVCFQMLRKYNVNFFKFDGTGNADRVFPGSRFDSDFDALIHLIDRLRAEKPDLFISVTTGTQPSPFWLLYADSIWRGGNDHDFAGVGSPRQRWITYRDAQTYKNIVQKAPLYPLNSLMLHGIIYAKQAKGLNSDPNGDFGDEVHSYFGSGTGLQEMYITPSLLTVHDWDILASTARWARSNAETLKDTHWIGGDPGRLQIYGWAAWSRANGIVTLRNPSDKKQDFLLDIKTAFELPPNVPLDYVATDPWNMAEKAQVLRVGQPIRISMKPFEVRTLEARPMHP